MSSLDANPITLNKQSPLNFVLRLQRAPSLSYFCNTVKIPDVVLGVTDVGSPSLTVPFIGDHMRFGPLEITFQVDSDLQNYLEVFNWLKGIGNPSNKGKILQILEDNANWTGYGVYSDIQLLTTDSYRNPSFQINFERAFPFAVSGLHFETVDPDVHFITCSVGFRFTEMHVETI